MGRLGASAPMLPHTLSHHRFCAPCVCRHGGCTHSHSRAPAVARVACPWGCEGATAEVVHAIAAAARGRRTGRHRLLLSCVLAVAVAAYPCVIWTASCAAWTAPQQTLHCRVLNARTHVSVSTHPRAVSYCPSCDSLHVTPLLTGTHTSCGLPAPGLPADWASQCRQCPAPSTNSIGCPVGRRNSSPLNTLASREHMRASVLALQDSSHGHSW